MIDQLFSKSVSYVAHFGGNVSGVLFFFLLAGAVNIHPGTGGASIEIASIWFAVIGTVFFDVVKEYLDYTKHKSNGVPMKRIFKMAVIDFFTDGLGIWFAVYFILSLI